MVELHPGGRFHDGGDVYSASVIFWVTKHRREPLHHNYFSNVKIRFQSFFMLITFQPLVLASS